MRETRVRALVWEDPLEKEMATHCSTLFWKIPWTEKPGRLQSMGSQRVGYDLAFRHAGMIKRLKVQKAFITVPYTQEAMLINFLNFLEVVEISLSSPPHSNKRGAE